jgi:hypothetical protein
VKEFFLLVFIAFLGSCGSPPPKELPSNQPEIVAYRIDLQRTATVQDTLASADYPMQKLQDDLDALVANEDAAALIEAAAQLAAQLQELENSESPIQFLDTGLRSRLKLLRTYLLQLKGALEEQDAVEAASQLVNEANNALVIYWNNLQV